MKNSRPDAENAQNWTKLIGTGDGIKADYSSCIILSIHLLAKTAYRRHQLGAEPLHQVRVAAVMIGHELDSVGGRLRRQVGHIDRNRFGQVDLFLDFRVLTLGHVTAVQPGREALVILDADAAVADPQLVLGEMLLLR